MKNRKPILFLLAIFLIAGSCGYLHAETMLTKKGDLFRGKVISENADEVIFADNKGANRVIKRNDILYIRPDKPEERPKTSIATESPSKSMQGLERPALVFDNRKWKLGFQNSTNDQLIAEYVLEGETVENWSELVTAQLLLGLQQKATVAQFLNLSKNGILKACPNVHWNVIREGTEGALYEWSIQNCQSAPDQIELARIIVGKDGFHVLHYAKKTSNFNSADRSAWIDRLEASKIIE